MGLETAAILAIVNASAAGLGAVASVKAAGKSAPAQAPQSQPEKAPVLDLFKRRARGVGAYGTPTNDSLAPPSTGTALLGQ